jgi:beta-glucosidase
MADSKHSSDNTQDLDRVLGDDPFKDADIEWIDREEGTLYLEVLGQDPFEETDLGWMYGEPTPEEPLLPESAPAETDLPMGGIELEPFPTTVEAGRLAPEPVPDAMPRATFHFPADFRWGVATAAHEVEGENIHNDWWAWEQTDGHIEEGHTSGMACDWWRNAESDFDRAAQMGVDAMRLSVEWSRIEPRPGVFDDAALERYSEMLQGLRRRDIEPMVTLHHFSNPRWLAEQGGWEASETVARFANFVRRTVQVLAPHCDLWCTINEPNTYAFLAYLDGVFPPGESDLQKGLRVMRNMLSGHAAAYREIHALQPHARVGLAHNMRVFDPFNPRSALDRSVTRITDRVFNQAILTALTRGRWTLPLGLGFAWKLRRTLDWIGLNYYTRDLVAFDRAQSQSLFGRRQHAEGAELFDGDYGEFYPRGIFRCIRRLARLGLPIYITENGVPDDDDDQRPRYLLSHLHQVWHAIQRCYPVMGYYHWTLVDNFEWAEGWTLRFGLISLDPATQARAPRPSAHLYADVIRDNGITSQVVDAYAPELRPELLPT